MQRQEKDNTKNNKNSKYSNKPDKDRELTKLNKQTNIFERPVEQQPTNTSAHLAHRH